MVFYVGMDCTEGKHQGVLKMKLNQTPRDCNSGFVSNTLPNVLLPSIINNTSQRKFQIKIGSSQLQNIGLNINTKVQLKPKKRLKCRDYISTVLFCLLVVLVILTYLQSQELRNELEATRKHLDILEENMDSAIVLYKHIQMRLKYLEDSFPRTMRKQLGHTVIKREAEVPKVCYSCSNSTRLARSVRRGPFAVHLRGALPEISVRDGGIIAPWYIDKTSSGTFLLVDGIVGEGKGLVEIVEEGLYFIYAQMYYLTSSSLNSFAINLQQGEEMGRKDIVVAICSAEAATNKLSELSCYTAVVRYLRRGDRVYVTQRERNRRILFRDNKSFLGLTLLNSPHGFTH